MGLLWSCWTGDGVRKVHVSASSLLTLVMRPSIHFPFLSIAVFLYCDVPETGYLLLFSDFIVHYNVYIVLQIGRRN